MQILISRHVPSFAVPKNDLKSSDAEKNMDKVCGWHFFQTIIKLLPITTLSPAANCTNVTRLRDITLDYALEPSVDYFLTM